MQPRTPKSQEACSPCQFDVSDMLFGRCREDVAAIFVSKDIEQVEALRRLFEHLANRITRGRIRRWIQSSADRRPPRAGDRGRGEAFLL